MIQISTWHNTDWSCPKHIHPLTWSRDWRVIILTLMMTMTWHRLWLQHVPDTDDDCPRHDTDDDYDITQTIDNSHDWELDTDLTWHDMTLTVQWRRVLWAGLLFLAEGFEQQSHWCTLQPNKLYLVWQLVLEVPHSQCCMDQDNCKTITQNFIAINNG